MRAAIYARYSSDSQREASIADQIRICRERAKAEGWHLTATYSDQAISGASLLRPGIQEMIQDAQGGKFEIIVAEALDRLSRDQEDIAGLYKRMRFAGIQIFTLSEGRIDELHVGLGGLIGARYLKDLADKTRRGLRGRVEAGKSGGGNAYGYDVVKAHDGDGNPIRGDRRINAAEAVTVRRVFEAFAAGKSPRRIAHELNEEGVSGPMGRPWRDTAIRGHQSRGTGILNNELYMGRLVWNRLRYIKDPVSGKRVSRLNRRDEWIIQEVPHLRMIDDDLWNNVKERQRTITGSPGVAKARSTEFWKRRRAKHLLTGKVRCGACGANFASVGRNYLACSAARGQGTCSNSRGIRRDDLDDLILDALKNNLMHPDLVREFAAAFHDEINRAARARHAENGIKRKELAATTRRLDGLIDAIADGLRTPGLKDKLEDLEWRKATLEAALESEPAPVHRLHPNLAAVYRRRVAHLRETLRDPMARDETLEILRELIGTIEVGPVEAGYRIELSGEIANMIELGTEGGAAPREGAGVLDAYRCSAKVVAGAGFEPATFRL